jgi:uncharacterized protein
MLPAAILALLGLGFAAGLLAGLVGVGGGVLMVPVLYLIYAQPEWFGFHVDPALIPVVAHATSLAVIVPTAVRGTLTFRTAGLVEWRAVWGIGITSVPAAVVAAQVAPHLPPAVLKLAFGLLLLYAGVRLLRPEHPDRVSPDPGRDGALGRYLLIGVVVGFSSALLGVGGGIVAIPLMIHWVGIDIRKVAATSIGMVLITAVAGVFGYLVSGSAAAGRPEHSVGFIHLAAALPLAVGAFTAVAAGARLNQRLRPRGLSLVFGSLFFLAGLRLTFLNLLELLG